MVKNYLKISLRNLFKDKVFTIINILGLSVGMSAFILILLFVQHEQNYEDFLPDNEIYRVTLEQYRNNELVIATAENYPGVVPAMVLEIPEVISSARLYNMGYKNNIVITYEDAPNGPVQFRHRKFMYADSAFLPMFGYELISGDVNTALAEPFSAVISEEYAQMYFGDENPLGKMLRLQDDDFNDENCKVTGIIRNLPSNTHLPFDVLFSYKTLYARGEWAPGRYDESWQRSDMYSYVKVREGVNPQTIEEKLPELVNKYSPDLAERGMEDILRLQALNDIHLNSDLAEEAKENGDARAVSFLGLIGFFIILIAWINYINLSTTKAMDRANEVGVRKALGALKKQLVWQFLSESAIINLAAVLLTVGIIIISIPVFNNISGLSLGITALASGQFILLLALLWLIGTCLSGLYPAFIISAYSPVSVLRGRLKTSKGGALVRKLLVTFQFTASVILIAGTIIVYQQLSYLRSQDIGMNIDQILVIERPGISDRDRNTFAANVDAFRDQLMQHPDILSVSGSITIPGKKREYKVPVKRYGYSDDRIVTLRFNSMDYSFIDVFGMQVIAGRGFSEDFVADQDTSIILGESAVKLLGFESADEAIGQTVTIDQFRWNPIIVGVVNDYNQESLKKDKDPMIFYCTQYGGEYYSLKINTNDYQGTINHAKESWDKAFAGNPFEYFFLDEYFNNQYENDQRFGNLFAVFAILAIFVGCLGLFGLSAFMAQQKTKEIGVRKVLGSSIAGIMVLLSKDFTRLVIIACVIGLPIVYYLMNSWLDGFATRISINLFVLLFAGLLVLVFAIIPVSYQTYKAAKVNPTDSLKYE